MYSAQWVKTHNDVITFKVNGLKYKNSSIPRIEHNISLKQLQRLFFQELTVFVELSFTDFFAYLEEPETENKKGVHFRQMFEFIAWCSWMFYFQEVSFVQHICCYNIEFTNYADDTTHYLRGQDFSSIIEVLEPKFSKLFNWFSQNKSTINSNKNHFLSSPYKKGPRKCTTDL